ncbi:hypothetical protein SAMN05192583_1678 [Sphingomonas gellani]|uniref:Uncharacterized protein n=1 Tax=Sphingomonas gellani TaxID=1166340 RepID=A0A1H8CMM1_9SPHN|nr:hypothetical protein [Sphingomonas gellani]SEM96226.1 hypothetical protein SAMN05192583_1678 [Sphingomonas gellani]
MTDKVPTPVAGGDKNKGAPDGVNSDPGAPQGAAASGGGESDGGESDGGAYPNPHTGKKGGEQGGFMGHGGQTEIAYSGTGQGGHDDDEDVGNSNAVTK